MEESVEIIIEKLLHAAMDGNMKVSSGLIKIAMCRMDKILIRSIVGTFCSYSSK